jgi:hypothetical protein
MTTPWYALTNFIDLQRNLVNDLTNNSSDDSLKIINKIDANLNDLNTAVQEADKSIGPELTKQQQVKDILDREEQRLKDRQQAIDSADQQQKRMVELTGNAILRNKAINQMYIVVVIALLLFVGVKLVAGFIPEVVADLLVIIIVSGAIVIVAYMYYDYTRRNNMNYHEINLGDPAEMVKRVPTDSSNRNLLDLRLNGCVGQGCCAPGTTFNEKYSVCVPNAPEPANSNDAQGYFIGTDGTSGQLRTIKDVCTGGNTYSATELACVPSTAETFTTMISVKPYEPTEVVDYATYN